MKRAFVWVDVSGRKSNDFATIQIRAAYFKPTPPTASCGFLLSQVICKPCDVDDRYPSLLLETVETLHSCGVEVTILKGTQ